MLKLLIFAAVAAYAWKLISGRWPWEPKGGPRAHKLDRARRLLGVTAAASREEIVDAHRRRVAQVHPDRGGSNVAVYEANDARDLLLEHLPPATPGA